MKALKILFIGAALAAALAGCKKQEAPPPVVVAPAPVVVPAAPAPAPAPVAAEISVSGVALGTVVNPDMSISSPATTFAPTDTIHAAVSTKNASTGATLAAKWTYQDGQTVHEETVTIAPTSDEITDFHVNSPKGFPAGNYKVEISLNGNVVNSTDFSIK
jgi:hypothetical protein